MKELNLAELLAWLAMLAGGRVKINFDGHVTVWSGQFNGIERFYDAIVLHYENVEANKTGEPEGWENAELDGEVVHVRKLYGMAQLPNGSVQFRWSDNPDRLYTVEPKAI